MSNAAKKPPEPWERTVQDALAYAESIVDTVRDPLLVLDADLRVRSASRSFYEDFGVKPEETEGRLVYELGNGQWDIPELRTLLEAILPENGSFRDFEVTHDLRGHRAAADAPERPQGPPARQPFGTHPARHRGRHPDVAAGRRFRRQPRAIPGHRRGGRRVRHLHVRHRGRHHELERRGPRDARLHRRGNPRRELPHHLHARGRPGPACGRGDADRREGGAGPR